MRALKKLTRRFMESKQFYISEEFCDLVEIETKPMMDFRKTQQADKGEDTLLNRH